jgi:hypothetical protein
VDFADFADSNSHANEADQQAAGAPLAISPADTKKMKTPLACIKKPAMN